MQDCQFIILTNPINNNITIISRSITNILINNKYQTAIDDFIACQVPAEFISSDDCRDYITRHINEAKSEYNLTSESIILNIPIFKGKSIKIVLEKINETHTPPIIINGFPYEIVYQTFYPEWKGIENLFNLPEGKYAQHYYNADEHDKTAPKDTPKTGIPHSSLEPHAIYINSEYYHKNLKRDHNFPGDVYYDDEIEGVKFWQQYMPHIFDVNFHGSITREELKNIKGELPEQLLGFISALVNGWMYENLKVVAFRNPCIELDIQNGYCKITLLRCTQLRLMNTKNTVQYAANDTSRPSQYRINVKKQARGTKFPYILEHPDFYKITTGAFIR